MPSSPDDGRASEFALQRPGLRGFFSSGWAFFLPYGLVYALAFGLGWTNDTARALFWACHFVLLATFAAFVVLTVRPGLQALPAILRGAEVWFWLLLCLGFLLPGAYMEFPADPWEHFRRLHAWDPGVAVRDSPWAHRFAYFWGWTLFSAVPLDRHRLAADLYSAFWQILLAYQFQRFALRLCSSRAWARVHVVGAVALFGNNAFGFFRYYALSSTMLAYIAYLAAAIVLIDFLDGRVRAWQAGSAVAATIALISFNHPQEVFLLALFAGTAALSRLWSRLPGRARLVITAAALASVAVSVPLARRALADPAAFGLTADRFGFPYLSATGSYRIWDLQLSYFATMGVQGYVAVLLVPLLWRRHRLVALLTLAPLVILLCPLFAVPLAQLGPRHVFTYRLLFLLPSSVPLIIVLEEAARLVPARSGWSDRLMQAVALTLMLGLGLHERSPVFGKLRLQYYRASPFLEARYGTRR